MPWAVCTSPGCTWEGEADLFDSACPDCGGFLIFTDLERFDRPDIDPTDCEEPEYGVPADDPEDAQCRTP